MASYYKLTIEQRSELGTSTARSMRRNGKIPANYYYHGEANQNIAIDRKIFNQAVQSGQKVFEVEMNGETLYVMIKDAQYHPVTEDVIHIDLMRVRRTEKMTFSIPIVLEGEAAGAAEGGLVAQVASSIEIECFPTDVPENVTLDISSLELNGVMTASELNLLEDVVLISPEDTTIALCSPPKAEVEPEAEELEEGEEGESSEGSSDGEEKDEPEKGEASE
ncbi:MAG: 50S ribosomal protein L25 [Candidatus Marinimicrobia bacterium]|nr:50S ribosomal protein L25 [Candidatus Neomarinimicrobiota bacterium]